jgi:sec-independent protein translocase protein TatA
MGSMSIWHLLIIAFIMLMVFGPNRIGDMGGSLGKAIRNFKKGLEGIDDIDVTHSNPNQQLHPGVQTPVIPQAPVAPQYAPPPPPVAQQGVPAQTHQQPPQQQAPTSSHLY